MTKTGRQFINEFQRELEEKRIDDNSRIWVSQGLNFTTASLTAFFFWTPTVLLSSFLTVLGVFTVGSADIEAAESMRVISSGEVAATAYNIINFSTTLACFTGIAFFVYRAVLGRFPFSNKHKERERSDWKEERLLKRMVEVQEELLVRHGLIDGDCNEKSD